MLLHKRLALEATKRRYTKAEKARNYPTKKSLPRLSLRYNKRKFSRRCNINPLQQTMAITSRGTSTIHLRRHRGHRRTMRAMHDSATCVIAQNILKMNAPNDEDADGAEKQFFIRDKFVR